MLSLLDTALYYVPFAAGIALFFFILFKHRKGVLSGDALKKPVIIVALFLAFATAARIAIHYLILKNDASFGAFLLPPHQPLLDWFAPMALKRYLFPYIVSLAAGALMYGIAAWTNKFFNGELFADEDKYIFAAAALVIGWPSFVLYLASALVLTVFLSGIATLRHGADTRIVLTDALIYSILVAFVLSITVGSLLPLNKLTIFA